MVPVRAGDGAPAAEQALSPASPAPAAACLSLVEDEAMPASGGSPCRSCGACCAAFVVAFYWAEADDGTPGGVPAGLTVRLDPWRRAMRGTAGREARCVALRGTVGKRVTCQVYARRPSPCRQFAPSGDPGGANPRCDRVRALFGLPPLNPWRHREAAAP